MKAQRYSFCPEASEENRACFCAMATDSDGDFVKYDAYVVEKSRADKAEAKNERLLYELKCISAMTMSMAGSEGELLRTMKKRARLAMKGLDGRQMREE